MRTIAAATAAKIDAADWQPGFIVELTLSAMVRLSTRNEVIFNDNIYVPAVLDVQNITDDSSSGALIFNDETHALQTLVRSQNLIGKRVRIARMYQGDAAVVQSINGGVWTVAGFATVVPDLAGAYLHLEGSDGSFASTPNTSFSDLVVTGTFRLETKVAWDQYNAATAQTLIGKWGAGIGQFLFTLESNMLRLRGVGVTTGYATVAVACGGLFTDGVAYIFRVDRVLSTGAVTFSYSADDGATFTQVGATQVLMVNQLLVSTSDAVALAANGVIWVPRGKVYWAKIYSDLGVSLVYDFRLSPSAPPFWYFDGFIQSASEGAPPQITLAVSRDAARRSLSPNKRIGPSTGFNAMTPEGQIIRFRNSAFRIQRAAV